ncbi:MAG: hypothetical protein DRN20_02105 [Thermoplasmata archaeon]|nr:MAG: hypothetical protein DRN20_02105 [Thermoplasmata archaeon]
MSRILVLYAGKDPKKLLKRASEIYSEGDDVIVLLVTPQGGNANLVPLEENTYPRMKEALEYLENEGIKASAIVARGDLVDELISVCGDVGCDIVIVPAEDVKCGPFHIGNVYRSIIGKVKAVVMSVE